MAGRTLVPLSLVSSGRLRARRRSLLLRLCLDRSACPNAQRRLACRLLSLLRRGRSNRQRTRRAIIVVILIFLVFPFFIPIILSLVVVSELFSFSLPSSNAATVRLPTRSSSLLLRGRVAVLGRGGRGSVGRDFVVVVRTPIGRRELKVAAAKDRGKVRVHRVLRIGSVRSSSVGGHAGWRVGSAIRDVTVVGRVRRHVLLVTVVGRSLGLVGGRGMGRGVRRVGHGRVIVAVRRSMRLV
jgi:hypothetical protein